MGEDQEQRICEALERIAVNTTPADVDLKKACAERDATKSVLATTVAFIARTGEDITLAMSEPDLMLRSRDLRRIAENCNKAVVAFKPKDS